MPRGDYKPIALCDTKCMSDDDWHIMRQGYIGGSDTAAIFDLSPWKSSLELYHQKTGVRPVIKKEFHKDNKDAGHQYEEYVLRQFMAKFKKKYGEELVFCESIEEFNKLPNAIMRDTHFYQCGRRDDEGNLMYPFAAGNIDAIMKYHGRIGVVECKTFNVDSKYGKKSKKTWTSGKVPIYYDYQGRYYMAILNVDYCFYACAWGFLSEQFSMLKIDRDYEIEDVLMEKCKEFYHAVTNGLGWDASNSKAHLLRDYYTRLYGEADERKTVRLDPCWYNLMSRFYDRQQKRDALKTELESMEDEDDELLALLLPVIKNAGFAICKKGVDTITVKITTPMKRGRCVDLSDNALSRTARLDWEGLKESNPAVWQECQTTTFDPSKLKNRYPTVYRKFKLPSEPSGEPNSFEAKKTTM